MNNSRYGSIDVIRNLVDQHVHEIRLLKKEIKRIYLMMEYQSKIIASNTSKIEGVPEEEKEKLSKTNKCAACSKKKFLTLTPKLRETLFSSSGKTPNKEK